VAELQSLTVTLNDGFTAGATAVAQAADKMGASLDKVAQSSETTDAAIRTRGQTLDSVQRKIDGVAASTAKLEQIDRLYESRVQVLTAGLQARGRSATDIAEAISRLGTVRDQDAAKARAQGDAIEQKFTSAATATNKLGESSNAAASGMRNLSIQVIQGVSGIASGQPMFTTLIQQGHQVADSMLATGQSIGSLASSVRTAFAAIGGFPTVAVVAGTAALYELIKAGNTSLGMLASVQQAVRGNHDDFETLGQTVIDAAKKVSQSFGLGLDEALATAKTWRKAAFSLARRPTSSGSRATRTISARQWALQRRKGQSFSSKACRTLPRRRKA
jgi:hypothetical protein